MVKKVTLFVALGSSLSIVFCSSMIHFYFLAQMMIPRVSFFPLVYEKLEKLYSRAAGKQAEDELWLSAEATPLKW